MKKLYRTTNFNHDDFAESAQWRHAAADWTTRNSGKAARLRRDTAGQVSLVR